MVNLSESLSVELIPLLKISDELWIELGYIFAPIYVYPELYRIVSSLYRCLARVMCFTLSGPKQHVVRTKKYVYPNLSGIYKGTNKNFYPDANGVWYGFLFRFVSSIYQCFLRLMCFILSGPKWHVVWTKKYVYPIFIWSLAGLYRNNNKNYYLLYTLMQIPDRLGLMSILTLKKIHYFFNKLW